MLFPRRRSYKRYGARRLPSYNSSGGDSRPAGRDFPHSCSVSKRQPARLGASSSDSRGEWHDLDGRVSRMRYVVTGGAGFIGSNTVDELVRRGHSVVVLDDLSAGKEENLAEVRNKISFVKGSIIDMEAVQNAIHQAEYVLHLAARTSVPRSVKDPLETNRINVDGTLNVLVAARDNKVK